MIREILIASSFPDIGQGVRRDQFIQCLDLVWEVQKVAYWMSRRFVRDEEMPRPLMHVTRIAYFIDTAFDYRWERFLGEEQCVKSLTAEFTEALEIVGAAEHADLVREIGAYSVAISRNISDQERVFDMCQDEILRLRDVHLSASKLDRRYPEVCGKWEERPDELHDLRWSAPVFLCARYIDSLPIFRRVATEIYAAELDHLVDAIPEIAARRREYEASREWEKKAIERVMGTNEDTTNYTLFGIRHWKGRGNWEWNFGTWNGSDWIHHSAVFVDGEIIVFEGATNKVVTSAAAPECAVGSHVPSNAPSEPPPGQLGFNTRYKIGNR